MPWTPNARRGYLERTASCQSGRRISTLWRKHARQDTVEDTQNQVDALRIQVAKEREQREAPKRQRGEIEPSDRPVQRRRVESAHSDLFGSDSESGPE